MPGTLRLDILDDAAEHLHVVNARASALPIDIAGEPLAKQFMP
jgi:hypothetical protein